MTDDSFPPASTPAGEEGDSALARFGMLAEELHLTKVTGRLTGVAGKVLEAQMPRATVGSLVRIASGGVDGDLLAEVVGFRDNTAILAPLGSTDNIQQRAKVSTEPTPLSIMAETELFDDHVSVDDPP